MQALTQIVGVVRLLCQDLSQDIRAAVCSSAFVPLAAAVGPERCASLLLPELIELIQVRRGHMRKRTCNFSSYVPYP